MTAEQERRRRAAARSKRHRDRKKRHGAGDHSICVPESACRRPATPPSGEPSAPVDLDETGLNDGTEEAGSDASEGVTRDVTGAPKNPASRPPRPADLGDRGGRLWDEMSGLNLGAHHVLLLERACRKADRLDRMDAQLTRRDWFDVVEVPNTDGAVVQVVVDKLLSELRQTEIALKLDVAELRYARRPVAGAPGALVPAPGREADDDDAPAAGQQGEVTNVASIFGRATQGG